MPGFKNEPRFGNRPQVGRVRLVRFGQQLSARRRSAPLKAVSITGLLRPLPA